MAKLFDADGNEVEAFTQEELDAKLAEAVSKVTPPVVEKKNEIPAENKNEEPPAWAKSLIETVEKLSGNQRSIFVGEIEGSLDADKKEAFKSKFSSLTGYDESPEGIRRRAEDAYLLTTGQPYTASSINMANVVAAGGGPAKPSAPKPEVEEGFKQAFGITNEDVEKYAPKS